MMNGIAVLSQGRLGHSRVLVVLIILGLGADRRAL